MRSLIAAFGLAACAATVHADVVLSDGTFLDSNWVVESAVSPLNIGSVSALQVTSGGNPGAARSVTLASGVSPGDTMIALHRFGVTQGTRYDPATQGAISSVRFALDARVISSSSSLERQSFRFALKQGLVIYAASLQIIPGEAQWFTIDSGALTASSFVQIGGSGTPNFSASGAPIRFGFATEQTTTAAAVTSTAFYDNFAVTIVPGPGSAFVLAGAGLLAARRRR